MKHIKSYEQFLNEAEDKAKEIENKLAKMGEVSDDSEEIKKNPVASNPFTNGSYTNHKYNSFIKEWENK